ncbi:uncharacterized protein WCC33_001432 [Rhinophrynus dorsalis]
MRQQQDYIIYWNKPQASERSRNGPVTFDDIAVSFSEEEWSGLEEQQRALYRDVMRDNYQNLTSLGLATTKPEIVVKIEKGEDPFVTSCQKSSPVISSQRLKLRNRDTKQAPGIRNSEYHLRRPRTNAASYGIDGQKGAEDRQPQGTNELGMGRRPVGQRASKRYLKSGKKPTAVSKDDVVRTARAALSQLGCSVGGEKEKSNPNEKPKEQNGHPNDYNKSLGNGKKDNAKEASPQSQNNGVHGKRFVCKSEDTTEEHLPGLQETDRKPYTCAQCGESWTNLINYLSHQMGHCQDRPHRCNICSKTFVKKQHLTSHRRIHTEERPFTCGQCGRSFRQNSTLTTHLWSHAGHKPFHCSCCTKSFSRKTDLVAHMRRHTGERPYECPYCWERFIRKKSLQRHLNKHAGETLMPGWERNYPRGKLNNSVMERNPKLEAPPQETASTITHSSTMEQLYFRASDEQQMRETEGADRGKTPLSSPKSRPVVALVKLEDREEEEKPVMARVQTKHQTTQTEPQKKKPAKLHQEMLRELKRFRRTSVRIQQQWDSMRSTVDDLSREMREMKEMVASLCPQKTSINAYPSAAESNAMVMPPTCPVWRNPERSFDLQTDDGLSMASGRASPESSLHYAHGYPLRGLSEEGRDHASWMYVTSSHDEDDLLPSTTAMTPVKQENDPEPSTSPESLFYKPPDFVQYSMGERLPNIAMLPLSTEREWTLLARSGGKPGRFAALVFRALVPFDIYKGWVNHVNLDGLRGRKGIPLNVKRRVMGIVERHFTLRRSEHSEIRNRLNEQLRTRRKSDKHPQCLY